MAEACRAAIADGYMVGVDYEGDYRVDWTNALSEGLEHPIIHSTFGYAAQLVVLDPESGDALPWNPGKTRGVGGKDMLATGAGLWVGSDGALFNGEPRSRIAFCPL